MKTDRRLASGHCVLHFLGVLRDDVYHVYRIVPM
ncbi:hypothetical protein CGRA01v4_05990 [Colletotrichum graminicola]|nr:hypothetical protein CGRA01v4_05990 [Colletotrichum graminicola]